MSPISVLIVDDHPLMREALVAAIECDPGLTGEAATGYLAVQRYRELHPDVVIMDLFMPGMDGITATAAICAQDPQAHILVFTSLTEGEKVMQAVAAGALGYLLKDAARAQILEGVRCVADGEPFLPSATTNKLMHALQHPTRSTSESHPFVTLTERELDILAHIARGLTDTETAVELKLTTATVRVHLHHIVTKLHVQDRNQAVVWYKSLQAPLPTK